MLLLLLFGLLALHGEVLVGDDGQLCTAPAIEHLFALWSNLDVRVVLIVYLDEAQMQHLQQIVLPVLERHIPATAVCLQHIISLLIKLLIGRATQDIN